MVKFRRARINSKLECGVLGVKCGYFQFSSSWQKEEELVLAGL
jgi:hypothetical protein